MVAKRLRRFLITILTVALLITFFPFFPYSSSNVYATSYAKVSKLSKYSTTKATYSLTKGKTKVLKLKVTFAKAQTLKKVKSALKITTSDGSKVRITKKIYKKKSSKVYYVYISIKAQKYNSKATITVKARNGNKAVRVGKKWTINVPKKKNIYTNTSGTKSSPANAKEWVTRVTYDGVVKFRITDVFYGEEALNKLEELGEDRGDFTYNDSPDYKTLFIIYEVKIVDGYKDTFCYGDEITGTKYDENKKPITDYLCYDFQKNGDKDLFLDANRMQYGEIAIRYAAYGIPSNIKGPFYEDYRGVDDTYQWITFNPN